MTDPSESKGNIRRREDQTLELMYDWYQGPLPSGLIVGEDAYIDTSFAFAMCASRKDPSVIMGDACGLYDRATLVLGPEGFVEIGKYSFLNGTYVICSKQVSIGAYVMIGWGAVISDTWLDGHAPPSVEARRRIMHDVSVSQDRMFPMASSGQPVVIEDNVWVGFDAVILPGSKLGRGCIVAAKTVVSGDVEPYSIVAGSPARVIGNAAKNDAYEAELRALVECRRKQQGPDL